LAKKPDERKIVYKYWPWGVFLSLWEHKYI